LYAMKPLANAAATTPAAAAASALVYSQQVMSGNTNNRPSTAAPPPVATTAAAATMTQQQQLKNRSNLQGYSQATYPIVTSDTDGGYCTTEDGVTITATKAGMKRGRPPTTTTATAPVAAPSSSTTIPRAALISCDSATDYDTATTSNNTIITAAANQRHQANLQSIAHERNLAAQEKLRNNRERNREHAKNTRIRKKAYVERLNITVDELCRERDALVSERATSANLMVEIHSKRVDVLRSLFALRASYNVDQRRELWSSLLDECCFTCRLPVTPYQSFPSSEVQVSNCQRTIVGVDAMMNDVASNAVFLDSIVNRQRYPKGKIKFHYKLVTDETPIAGNQLMARWSMETLNAKQCGAHNELHQNGMLHCKFNSSHKIVSLEMMFDVMAFMLQVKMAMGYDNFNDVVIPNTVQTCTKEFYYPMVMTSADRPYTITKVNERWEKLTGYKSEEVVGKSSCSILQGKDTTNEDLDMLMRPVLFKRPSCAMVTNYTKSGRRYRGYLTLYPLSTDSKISHYLGLTTFVQWIDKVGETGKTGHTDDDKKCASSSSPKSDSDNSNEASGGENQATSSSSSSDFPASGSSSQENKSNGIKEISTTPPNNEKQSLSSLTSSVSSTGSMCGNASNSSDMAVVGAPAATTGGKEKASSANDNVEMDTST
jgi:PAS domain S-box-containing protein